MAQPESVDVAAEFLLALFEPLRDRVSTEWVNLFALDRATGQRLVEWQGVSDIVDLARVGTSLPDSCVWFSMATHAAPLGKRRGSASDCTYITALWVDIDVAGPNHAADDLPPTLTDAAKLLASLPVPPSIVVATGGGLQAYWFLVEPMERDDAVELLARWGVTWASLGARRGWHVDNVFDISRVMRLPGTLNHKSDPAMPVAITHWHPERRYNVSDFDGHLLDVPEVEHRAPTLRLVPLLGNERPGDMFNATQRPGELLEAVGFVLDHVDGDAEHYRAPHHADERGVTGATVYSDGHSTIWSDTFARAHGMLTKRPYDAFGLLTHLQHGGDFEAASAALTGAGMALAPPRSTAQVAGELADALDDPLPGLVVWGEMWDEVEPDSDWIAEPLIALGRGHAIYAAAGTGKSLLALWLAVQIATGGIGLDGVRLVRRRVLYVDYEMTQADLRERLVDMGFDPSTDLSWLTYLLLPPFEGGDTLNGGVQMIRAARAAQADVVIVDTFGRAVVGDENEADTVRAWYRYTGGPLKAEHRSLLRTDHAGKDVLKGQRGSSSKNDDVDIVWRMERSDDGYKMTATKGRSGWVPEEVAIIKRTEPLSFSTGMLAVPAGTAKIIARLDELGVPAAAGRAACRDALKAAGEKVSTDVLRAAIKSRKLTSQTQVRSSLTLPDQASRPGRSETQTTRSDVSVSSQVRSGQLDGANGPVPVSIDTDRSSIDRTGDEQEQAAGEQEQEHYFDDDLI